MAHRLTQYVTWATDTTEIRIPGRHHGLQTTNIAVTVLLQEPNLAQQYHEYFFPWWFTVHPANYDVYIHLFTNRHAVTIVLTTEDDV